MSKMCTVHNPPVLNLFSGVGSPRVPVPRVCKGNPHTRKKTPTIEVAGRSSLIPVMCPTARSLVFLGLGEGPPATKTYPQEWGLSEFAKMCPCTGSYVKCQIQALGWLTVNWHGCGALRGRKMYVDSQWPET